MGKPGSVDATVTEKFQVVIAEDDPKISEIQTRFVEKVEGFEVVGIGNTISESEDLIEVFQPDLVLLDIYFPDGNGIDLLWTIRRLYKHVVTPNLVYGSVGRPERLYFQIPPKESAR